MNHSRLRMLLFTLVGVAALICAAQAPPTAGTPDGKLTADFQSRVKQYLDFREKTAGKSSSPSNAPDKILAKQKELADKMRVARAGAKQGEIFIPPVADYFRHQIAATMAGPHGKQIRASLQHAEPVKMNLQINQSYPPDVPLQSTPPTLLLNLPQLPDGMEYRLLDHELVLRDSEANIVVDYVPNALPEQVQ